MHIPPWLLYSLITVLAWGVVGLLQKLSTNYVSAESSLIWLVAGFLILEPFFYTGPALLHYSTTNFMYALIGGLLNALGAWALFAALKNGGKASIVAPVTALYPIVVIAMVPIVLHESVTRLQWVGVVCALIAVVLLSN
jgi:transporter family protein